MVIVGSYHGGDNINFPQQNTVTSTAVAKHSNYILVAVFCCGLELCLERSSKCLIYAPNRLLLIQKYVAKHSKFDTYQNLSCGISVIYVF